MGILSNRSSLLSIVVGCQRCKAPLTIPPAFQNSLTPCIYDTTREQPWHLQ